MEKRRLGWTQLLIQLPSIAGIIQPGEIFSFRVIILA